MLLGYLKTAVSSVPKLTAMWLSPDCSTADSPLHCRLLTWLAALEAAAGILTLILIVAAVFAFAAFRRNKARKLEKDSRS